MLEGQKLCLIYLSMLIINCFNSIFTSKQLLKPDKKFGAGFVKNETTGYKTQNQK